MTKQDIFDIITCFEGSTLRAMKLSTQEFSIELERGDTAVPASISSVSAPQPTVTDPAPQQEGPTVTAPLVGTYYAAPGPGQPPFVSVGDKVKKGQPLCLIEAMKMMSEIPAPCDCTIEAVLKTDGQLAAFGEPLFRYQPC